MDAPAPANRFVLQVLLRLEERLFTPVRDLVRLESTCRGGGPAGGLFLRLAQRWSGAPGSICRKIDHTGDGSHRVAKIHLHEELLFREVMRIIQMKGGIVIAGSFAASLNAAAQKRLAWAPRDVDIFTTSEETHRDVVRTYQDFMLHRRGISSRAVTHRGYIYDVDGNEPISPADFAAAADLWAQRYRARQRVTNDAELAVVEQLCSSPTAIPARRQSRGYIVVNSVVVYPDFGGRLETHYGRVDVDSIFPALNVVLIQPDPLRLVSQTELGSFVCCGFDLSPCGVSATIDNDYAYQPTYHNDAEECLERGVLRIRGSALADITRNTLDPFMVRVLKYLMRGFRLY
jgi:hypothetical protein